MTNILQPLRQEVVRITASLAKILAPGEAPARTLVCPHCERELDERHEVEGCRKKGEMPRRLFLGLLGASSAALSARLDGVPLPQARVQVIAGAGDMFEVETLNPFSIAWEAAHNFRGAAFKNDDGILQECGILHFHGQDIARPDKWLRVHRGLKDMNVLGIRDEVTGKPVRYRIVRNTQAEERVNAAYARQRADIEAAAREAQKLYIDVHGYHNASIHAEQQKPEVLKADMPNANREGIGKALVTLAPHFGYGFEAASLNITYRAGKTKNADQVEWILLGERPPTIKVDRPGKDLEFPTHFTGTLHAAIEIVNSHYNTQQSALIRKAIMGLNPEYRQRTGVVALDKITEPPPPPARLPRTASRRVIQDAKKGLMVARTGQGAFVPKRLAGPKGSLPV